METRRNDETRDVPLTSAESHVSADDLLADAARRQQIERELIQRGMTPAEVRLLLNADAKSTDRPASILPSRPASENGITNARLPDASPPSAPLLPPTPPRRKGGRVTRPSADSLQTYAAELLASRAQAQVEAVQHVALELPAFRPSTPQETIQAETLLREAAGLRRREKYPEAEAKVRAALELTPKDASALELLGDLFQGVARTNEALAAYHRAVEADPRRTSAERKYGELLMSQQDWSGYDPEAVVGNPVVAVAASLLLPGAGQVYNSEWAKSVFFFLADGLCFWMLALSPFGFAGEQRGRGITFGLLAAVVFSVVIYVTAAVDARNGTSRARRLNTPSGWNV